MKGVIISINKSERITWKIFAENGVKIMNNIAINA